MGLRTTIGTALDRAPNRRTSAECSADPRQVRDHRHIACPGDLWPIYMTIVY